MGRQRVAIAMSGGVDSAVAAAILIAEGHDVVGVTLRLHAENAGENEAGDARDALAMAERLGIELRVFDERAAFHREIVEPFVDAYLDGRTPNPCVRCNELFKLGRLVTFARELGADRLATGHYVRLVRGPDGALELRRGRDRTKDQSYFLFATPRRALESLRFPLGELDKSEVRERARELSLAVADKPESQDVCFIPGGDVGGFVEGARSGAGAGPGPIVDLAGRRLGTHRGLHRYTVGQRRGLGVAAREPLYVVSLETPENRLVVGERAACAMSTVSASDAHWLDAIPPRDGARVIGQIRYRHRGTPGRVYVSEDGQRFSIGFDEPVTAPAPGQALVLYDGDRVLGGGWIQRERSGRERSGRERSALEHRASEGRG